MQSQRFTDALQFYPTPYALAKRAWSLFETDPRGRHSQVKLLDPSAGEGDLFLPLIERVGEWEKSGFSWDAIEINAEHHAKLKSRQARVVGYDFMTFQGLAHYSHIIMNPPFNVGVKHVLHAWHGLFDGEIVAILNAESLRNLNSHERELLAQIVNEHGTVEFLHGEFDTDETRRKTMVEIALIHLVKRAEDDALLGNLIEGLVKDQGPAANEGHWETDHPLSLPRSFVDEAVYCFNLAVEAERQAAVAQARASHYKGRLGKTLAETIAEENEVACDSKRERNRVGAMAASVRYSFHKEYESLKDSAWTQILRSTYVMSRLSSKARQRLEREFENIKALEFTVSNIYGFLHGLAMQGGEIQMGMCCDVFDLITRYHSDNTVYYMGWKSNSKHRTAGMRIKRSRFIIPRQSYGFFSSSIGMETTSMLADFDRVFALLDGKQAPTVGLRDLFENKETFARLLAAERLSSDYFDVRYYKGIGTIHFFPKRPDVIERLNRVVGRHRGWLPASMDEASAGFTAQYEMAEKLQKEVVKTFAVVERKAHGSWYTIGGLTSANEEARRAVEESVCESLVQVLEAHGMQPFDALADESEAPLQLEMAA